MSSEKKNAKGFKRPLPGSSTSPSPPDNRVGEMEISKRKKIRLSVIYRVARASLYCPIVKAKKKKRFLLLLRHKNPQGLREAPVHTFQSQSVKMGLGEQGRKQSSLELQAMYLMP